MQEHEGKAGWNDLPELRNLHERNAAWWREHPAPTPYAQAYAEIRAMAETTIAAWIDERIAEALTRRASLRVASTEPNP